jgi:MFS family permease
MMNRRALKDLWNRIRDFFGLEHNVMVRTGSALIKGTGTNLWEGYLSKVLSSFGATGKMIGLFGSLGKLAGIGFPFVGGALSDRLGRGKAIILASLLGLSGYLFYIFAPNFWLFLPGYVLIAASVSFGFMGSLALTGETVGPKRRSVSIAAQEALIYLPAIIIPPLGGMIIDRMGIVNGFRLGLIVTVALTVAAIGLQAFLYRLPPPAAKKLSLDIRKAWQAMSKPLRRQLLADILVRFGSGMAALFTVLYLMDVLGIPALQFGLLLSLERAMRVILPIPLGKLADRMGVRSRWPFVAFTYLFFAVFPIAMAAIPSSSWLVPVYLLAGLRHSGETARKALIIDLAGEGEHGRIIGLYYMLLGIGTFPSSFLAGWIWEWNPRVLFLISGAISLIGLVWFLLKGPKGHEK